jgi:nucleoside-diphosphate-sugar epimerase
MKTILLTGASGFIGQEFLKIVKNKNLKKYKIVLLSSYPNKDFVTILHKNYTFQKKDFLKKKINHLDIIIHLGAFIPKSHCESNNINKSYENIRSTKYLIDNLPNTPEKFIFASTIDVYGKLSKKIQEDSETKPLTMYAWSKLYCENMIENWSKEKKIVYQILRIGHIYGKGEENYKKVIPTTIKRIKNNKNPEIYGTGDDLRSFLHVSDISKLIIKTIELKKSNGVINLCNPKNLSIKKIIHLLIKISKKKQISIDYLKRKSYRMDYIFNTKKMNTLFKLKLMKIKDGLKNEYDH